MAHVERYLGVHVPPQWPLNPPPVKIAFIGEAPGSSDVEKGAPFMGASGRVFNSILRTANLDRGDYFITNVFDEKLPDNDLAKWCASLAEARAGSFADLPAIGGLGFLRPEHRWHLERLMEELQIARPNVIVPLGGTALWALTGDGNIGAHRGAVLPATKIVPGAKLLPTFHPAMVIHQWKLFSVVVGDLIKAHAQSRTARITYPKRRLILEPTLNDIRAFMPTMLGSSLLSVDIETGWGQITCIGFGPNSEEAITIPFLDKRQPNRNYWETAEEETEAWRLVRQVMASATPKLGQNFGAYDAYWLLLKAGIAPRNFRDDTRLLHHALYPELPKDLAFMGASYATQGAWKHWGKQGKEKRDD